MFQVGDRVVYPMHGAGTIISIEEKEFLGEKKSYYIMEMPLGEMRVMVPLDKVENLGLRYIISAREAEDVLQELAGEQEQSSKNWNRRYRANVEKIKTGDIFSVGEVVRSLSRREMEKGLSTGEKKLLNNARQILVSELVLAQDSSEQAVLETLEKIFTLDGDDVS